MAVKTFTTGEVLTAADTNTYLANSGLVYVTSQTVGTAVSSVSITSAFSADFDSYRIVMRGTNAAGGAVNILMTLGATTSFYYSTLRRDYYDGTSTTFVRVSSGAAWVVSIGGGANNVNFSIDIHNPYLAQRTQFYGQYAQGVSAGWSAGEQADSTSFTSFTIAPASSTITGGTITVYGYRKA